MSTPTTTPPVLTDPTYLNPLDVHQVAYQLIDEFAPTSDRNFDDTRSSLRCALCDFSLHFERPRHEDDTVADAIEHTTAARSQIRRILIEAMNIVAARQR